ncbi:hypothetical protein ACJJTC_015535 [Scirpophaga incertulas]
MNTKDVKSKPQRKLGVSQRRSLNPNDSDLTAETHPGIVQHDARPEAVQARITNAPVAGTSRPAVATEPTPPMAVAGSARSVDAPAQQRPGKAPAATTSERTLSSTSLTARPAAAPATISATTHMRSQKSSTAPSTGNITKPVELKTKNIEIPTPSNIMTRDPRLKKQASQDHPKPPGTTPPLPRVASPTPDNPPKSPQPFPSREASKEEIKMKPRKRPPDEDISAQRPGTLPRLEVTPATPSPTTLQPSTPSDIYLPQPSTSSSFVPTNYPAVSNNQATTTDSAGNKKIVAR